MNAVVILCDDYMLHSLVFSDPFSNNNISSVSAKSEPEVFYKYIHLFMFLIFIFSHSYIFFLNTKNLKKKLLKN